MLTQFSTSFAIFVNVVRDSPSQVQNVKNFGNSVNFNNEIHLYQIMFSLNFFRSSCSDPQLENWRRMRSVAQPRSILQDFQKACWVEHWKNSKKTHRFLSFLEVLVRILVLLKTSHGKPFQVLLDLLKMLAVFCLISAGLWVI